MFFGTQCRASQREYGKQVAAKAKTEPKNFWKYANSKSKTKSNITDLFINANKNVLTSSDQEKVVWVFRKCVYTYIKQWSPSFDSKHIQYPIIIIIIIRHAPSARSSPLAANSLHSGLFRASSIASSKVHKYKCRKETVNAAELGCSSEWPSRRCRFAQVAFSTHSEELQSELWWRLSTRLFWPDDQTAWVFFSYMIKVRGGIIKYW